MLHFSTKTLRLLKKVTKMLDNAYHTKAFLLILTLKNTCVKTTTYVNGYYIHITEQKIIL